MTTPDLSYRPFRRIDLPGVLKLWDSDSGWGALTEEDFDVWYVDTPNGESIISVAVDDNGEVYGQEVFFPMRTVVEDRVVRSLHLSAPILRASLREERITQKDHPVIRLYLAAMEEAAKQGYELMYATPQRAWVPFFQWLGRAYDAPKFMTKSFGCAGRLLAPPLPAGAGNDQFSLAPTKTFGAEYDDLWQRARDGWPIRCGNVRDARWVDWRNGDHLVLEARETGGSLAGYVSIRKDGLIVDVLSRELGQVVPVIAGAIDWLSRSAAGGDAPAPEMVKVMRHPHLEPAIRELGFEAVDFEFGFCCNTLGESVDRTKVGPDDWYMMPLY